MTNIIFLLIQANEHVILNTLILLVWFDYRIEFLSKAIDGTRVFKKSLIIPQFMAVNLEINWFFLGLTIDHSFSIIIWYNAGASKPLK